VASVALVVPRVPEDAVWEETMVARVEPVLRVEWMA
jgi:hypothetical protein